MKIFKIMLLLFPLVVSSCREIYDTRLNFANNSESSIYVITADIYKDTSYVYVNYYPGNDPETYKIQPHEIKTAIKPYGRWERVFEEQDTVAFYVFDAQVLETTPWDTVKAKYLVLKRYDLSLADLQRMNWTIAYP